jgi:hypothetical protein
MAYLLVPIYAALLIMFIARINRRVGTRLAVIGLIGASVIFVRALVIMTGRELQSGTVDVALQIAAVLAILIALFARPSDMQD